MLLPMGQGLSSLFTGERHLLAAAGVSFQAHVSGPAYGCCPSALWDPGGHFYEALSLADPPKFRHAAIRGDDSLTCLLRMGPCPALPG